MNLLAMVNRRVAAADPDKRVSPFCHVSFIGETDGVVDPPVSQVFAEHGEHVPFSMPMIAFGIDASFMAERMAARLAKLVAGADDDLPSIPRDEWDGHTKRRD